MQIINGKLSGSYKNILVDLTSPNEFLKTVGSTHKKRAPMWHPLTEVFYAFLIFDTEASLLHYIGNDFVAPYPRRIRSYPGNIQHILPTSCKVLNKGFVFCYRNVGPNTVFG
jgi:hypothetical protein